MEDHTLQVSDDCSERTLQLLAALLLSINKISDRDTVSISTPSNIYAYAPNANGAVMGQMDHKGMIPIDIE